MPMSQTTCAHQHRLASRSEASSTHYKICCYSCQKELETDDGSHHQHMWVWWGFDGLDQTYKCEKCGVLSYDHEAYAKQQTLEKERVKELSRLVTGLQM